MTAELELTAPSVSQITCNIGRNLTDVKLAVALLLADGIADTELGNTLVEAAGAALAEAGAGVAEAATDEAPGRTAAGTSGCFPDSGSVFNPQLEPAALSVLPYMRQMSKLSGPEQTRQFW